MVVNPENLVGLRVTNAEGERLGKVTHVFYDLVTNRPEWVGVKVGGFFNGGAKVIPLQSAQVREETIIVPYTRSFVLDAPEHWTTDVFTARDRTANSEYYNIPAATSTTPDATPSLPPESIDTATGEQPHPMVEPSAPVEPVDQTPVAVDPPVVEPPLVEPVVEPVVEEEVIRSEEELRVGKETVATGKVRVEKTVVTEPETVTVPVSHEEVVVERHPIDPVVTGTEVHPEEHEMTLHEERPVIGKETVAKERVRVRKEVVEDTAVVTEDVKKENVHVEQHLAPPIPAEAFPGEAVTEPPVEPVTEPPVPVAEPAPVIDDEEDSIDPGEPPVRPVDRPRKEHPQHPEHPAHPLGKEKKAKAPRGRLPRDK